MRRQQPAESDFEISVSWDAVAAYFRPSGSCHTFRGFLTRQGNRRLQTPIARPECGCAAVSISVKLSQNRFREPVGVELDSTRNQWKALRLLANAGVGWIMPEALGRRG
jgi:hypothetical protein